MSKVGAQNSSSEFINLFDFPTEPSLIAKISLQYAPWLIMNENVVFKNLKDRNLRNEQFNFFEELL